MQEQERPEFMTWFGSGIGVGAGVILPVVLVLIVIVVLFWRKNKKVNHIGILDNIYQKSSPLHIYDYFIFVIY